MPYTTFSSPVNTSFETLWNILVDKVDNPYRYISEVKESKILKRYNDGVLREMKTDKMTIKERITVDEQAREVRFTLVEHPLFTGHVINKVFLPSNNYPNNPLKLTFILDWQPTNEEAEKINPEEVELMIQDGVLHTKSIAEHQDIQVGN